MKSNTDVPACVDVRQETLVQDEESPFDNNAPSIHDLYIPNEFVTSIPVPARRPAVPKLVGR